MDGRTILRLARAGTQEALAQLGEASPTELANALRELEAVERVEVLEAAVQVDEVVPLLPEAEFTLTVRGAGIEESGWLVEFASSEQRVAAVDLDCWRDGRLSASRLFEWIDALIEAGPDTLVAAFDELDWEIWVLAMKEMGDFSVLGLGDLALGEGATDDGVVFYSAHTAEGEDRIREILTTALQYAPAHYWRLVYGAISESVDETAEFAARWQTNRLADLGFPDRRHAMRAYQPLRVDDALTLDIDRTGGPDAVTSRASHVPAQLGTGLVAQALAELPAHRATEVMSAIFALANTLAVADELPLTETGTIERSLAKALHGIERGLESLARARSLAVDVVLDTTPPVELFRIGATLDPALRPRKSLADVEAEQARSDWNRERETISENDRTLSADGRLEPS